MKVIGITSSFHAGSNSQRYVEEVLAGAEENGAETELIKLSDLEIKACIACKYCKKAGNTTCIQKDGMVKIYDALAQADSIVFGLPVYFGRANAPFLMMMDRMYAMIGADSTVHLPPNKKFAVAVTTGGDGLNVVNPIYDSIVRVFETYFKWEPKGLLCKIGVNDSKEIEKFPDTLKEARDLGKILSE